MNGHLPLYIVILLWFLDRKVSRYADLPSGFASIEKARRLNAKVADFYFHVKERRHIIFGTYDIGIDILLALLNRWAIQAKAVDDMGVTYAGMIVPKKSNHDK